jgi:hypothetical protein
MSPLSKRGHVRALQGDAQLAMASLRCDFHCSQSARIGGRARRDETKVPVDVFAPGYVGV